MIKYNQSDSHTVANVSLWYLHYPSFRLDFMKDFTKLQFEGLSFSSISQYDDFLKGIYGDYMIKSITLPLDINGTMNLSCTRALERI